MSDASTHPLPGPPIAAREALPPPVSTFVGRQDLLATLGALLGREDVRLVTLTGPGGVGKSRLALRFARTTPHIAGEVWYVSLAAIWDPALLAPAIARAIESSSDDTAGGHELIDTIGDREGLLILDNFEQLVRSSSLVAQILSGCPGIKILVTSRTLLRLSGEHVLEVPPLSLPPEGNASAPSDATQLFVERAREALPSFAPDRHDLVTIAAICQRLHGIPLAIELAASQVAGQTLGALRDRLDYSMVTLADRSRGGPMRHRTMRDTIFWSYSILDASERRLFRRLAVFVGGFPLAAAEMLDELATPAAAPDPESVPPTIDVLTALVDHSLVRPLPARSESGEPRFEMLGTIRELALENLEASSEATAIRDAHAAVFLRIAEEAETHLIHEVEPEWLDRLEPDLANFRAALEWTLSGPTASRTLGVRLAGTLWLFWYYHSHLSEGRAWLERAVAAGEDVPETARAKAMVGLGTLSHFLGEPKRAREILIDGLRVLVRLGDWTGAAYAMTGIGTVAEDEGLYDDAALAFSRARELFTELNDRGNVAVTLRHLGVVTFGQGDHQLALARLEEALELSRSIPDPWNSAASLSFLGLVRVTLGDHPGATAALAEALDLYVQLGTTERIVDVIKRVAVLIATGSTGLAALRLFSAARVTGERIGVTEALPERAIYEQVIDDLRQRHEGAADAAWTAGARLDLAAAVTEARRHLHPEPGGAEPAGASDSLGLSQREMDVLRLLGNGRSDAEIAAELGISRRTVTTHTGRIYAKLGVTSRTAAVATAMRNGVL